MIPNSSISCELAWPTPYDAAHRWIFGASRRRASGVSSLLSRTPCGAVFVDSVTSTIATVTGPLSAPRPTSSLHASVVSPSRSIRRSIRSDGGGSGVMPAPSIGVRHVREGVGTVQHVEAVARPQQHEHLADDVVDVDVGVAGAVRRLGWAHVVRRVRGVVAVVAHHEDLALRDRPDLPVAVADHRSVARGAAEAGVVLLVERLAVDHQPPLLVAALDDVALDADHALHQVPTGRVQP